MRSWHLPGPALISASPRELKARRPSEKPHPPPWQGPPTVSDSVGMGYCFHLCPQAILRAHQPGTICVPIPETLTWGACSVAQGQPSGEQDRLIAPSLGIWMTRVCNSHWDQRVRVSTGTTLGGFL